MYVPCISGYSDFISFHMNGTPVFVVNGKLQAGYDMLERLENRYNFTDIQAKIETEKAIAENMYMFDVVESEDFYYPNSNMFSGGDSAKHIKGQVLHLKDKYRDKKGLKSYKASGMSLVNGSWQSCGWIIEAHSFTEAAYIAESDKTYRLHSLSDNVVY